MPDTVKRNYLKNDRAQSRGYSQAVVTEGGRTIWLAGQVAAEDSAGRSLAADFDGQVREVFARLGHTLRFKNMTEEESAPLLRFLFAHQTRPEFTCRFRWEVGSLALWDNRCAQHNPINDYHGFRRVMHRVTLAGDKPR